MVFSDIHDAASGTIFVRLGRLGVSGAWGLWAFGALGVWEVWEALGDLQETDSAGVWVKGLKKVAHLKHLRYF